MVLFSIMLSLSQILPDSAPSLIGRTDCSLDSCPGASSLFKVLSLLLFPHVNPPTPLPIQKVKWGPFLPLGKCAV